MSVNQSADHVYSTRPTTAESSWKILCELSFSYRIPKSFYPTSGVGHSREKTTLHSFYDQGQARHRQRQSLVC